MCNCIRDLEKKMIGREAGRGTTKRKVVKAELVSGGLIFGANPAFRTSSIVECTLEGQKKPYEQNILHTFCPFCGEKYPTID
jgi:hypothetical protein